MNLADACIQSDLQLLYEVARLWSN